MKITVTVSHDFENVQAAIAFAAKLEPITKELEAPAPTLAAPVTAEAIEAKPTIDRANAETLNPSLADQLPEVQPSKRTRRTKAEMEAARAAEAEATPPPPAPAAKAEPVADVDPFDLPLEEPAKPAPVEMSEDDLKIAFQAFVKIEGWREILAAAFRALKIEKMRDVPASKRATVAGWFTAWQKEVETYASLKEEMPASAANLWAAQHITVKAAA